MTRDEIFNRYNDLFGYYPFFVYWRGSDEELQALCQKAIDRGSELTDEEIAEAKGEELPPKDALD